LSAFGDNAERQGLSLGRRFARLQHNEVVEPDFGAGGIAFLVREFFCVNRAPRTRL